MSVSVSIVIPSYQQAGFLRAAIDSVLAQDHQPLEVLVFDGGSTDGSVEILESYGDRIWFQSQRDGGQCHAINEGFKRSEGEVVAWLNSDDFYYPGAVRAAVAGLEAHPDAGMVYGEGNLVDRDGEVIERFPETVPFDLWRLANVNDYILQPTAFFRREALFRHGLLKEDLNWGLDWELWIRLGKHVPLCHVPEVLAASRLHDETKTATGGFKRLRELLGILRTHGVRGCSPAAVAHSLATVARAVRPSQGPITAAALSHGVPRGLQGVVRWPLARAERRVRRWLENAQGVWSDGLVGRVGRLWLPSDGRETSVRISGRNLDLPGQVVALRSGDHTVETEVMAPGQRFELGLTLREGQVPVKVELSCRQTTAVPSLTEGLGRRRVGCVLEAHEVAQ